MRSIQCIPWALSQDAYADDGWIWPVPASKTMSRGFGYGHRGIDIISTNNANETIVAARGGTVAAVYEGCSQWNGYGKDHSGCNPVAHLESGDRWGIRYYQDDGGTDVFNYGFGNGVVIDHGKVVEIGNHESLTAKRGAYYNLVKNQLELGN